MAKSRGEITLENVKKTLLAAQMGDMNASYQIGNRYRSKGTEKDNERAFFWFNKAAMQGSTLAQKEIIFMYTNGIGIEKNEKEAFKWIKKAADRRNPGALLRLGHCYATGCGTEKDEKKAFNAFQSAADLGSLNAQNIMGVKYFQGHTVTKDMDKALEYFKKAADNNHKEAQYNLAVLYGKKNRIEDAELIKKYFTLAANQGHKKAQYFLAMLLQQTYTLEDDQLAVHYMKLAADQGIREARHNLAVRYSVGRGVVQDLKQADYYFKLATSIDKHDAFYTFTSARSIKGLTASPAMFLMVSEKDAKEGVIEKGLYQHIFAPEVVSHKSYIPANPPQAKHQRGPTCGLKSLEIGLAWGYKDRKTPPARKNPIKRLTMDKDSVKKPLQVEGCSSLREYAKQMEETINGEIYNINTLKKAAAYFGFNQCETIKSDEDHYINTIIKAIHTKHSVILPVDNDKGFPGAREGRHTHYVLAWGYLFKNAEYHFLVTHAGKHFLWSATALRQSHLQLPKVNPCVGEYYKNRKADNYFRKDRISEADKSIIEEKNLRIVPESTLENFIWHALTIPTLEENFLHIDEKLVTDETSVATAIKSSDAVMLKLLIEQGASITPPKTGKTFEEIAKENHDPFSLTLLQQAAKKSSLDETPLSKLTYSGS